MNHAIRRIVLSSGVVTTIVGSLGNSGSTNGVGTAATLNNPTAVSLDSRGIFALVVRAVGGWLCGRHRSTCFFVWLSLYYNLQADNSNHAIRYINISSSTLISFAGSIGNSGTANGVGSTAGFFLPSGVSVDFSGTFALVVSEQ